MSAPKWEKTDVRINAYRPELSSGERLEDHSGYVHAAAPGLAVTAGVKSSKGAWVITHVHSGAMLPALYRTLKDAKFAALEFARLGTWERSADAIWKTVRFRESVRLLVERHISDGIAHRSYGPKLRATRRAAKRASLSSSEASA